MIPKEDNCIYAPGSWIGEETNVGGSGCGGNCYVHNLEWTVQDFSGGSGSQLAVTRFVSKDQRLDRIWPPFLTFELAVSVTVFREMLSR